jgi:hypothetical protein
MSTVFILAPIIISNWPAIVVAAAGAASALGFTVKQTVKEELQQSQVTEAVQTVEVELAESEILAQSVATDQQMVLTKGSVQIRIKRDERSRCTVCASGKGYSKTELKQIAQEFSQKLTQCFIYDKVMKELKSKNFQVINEEVMEDESIRIHVRRWVD